MSLSRRDLLQVALLAPAGVVVGVAASAAVRFAADAIARLRPPAVGTSATRCARCGRPDHTMLQPDCPLERKVI